MVGYARLSGERDDSPVVSGQALFLGKTPFPLGRKDPAFLGDQPETDSSIPANNLPKALLPLTKGESGSAFVLWEQEKEVLWLGTDRYGLKPFYYYHRNGELAFATSLDWLVRQSPRKFKVNFSALSQYLCLRHPFGDETLFAEINRLPQGALLRYSVAEDRLERIRKLTKLRATPMASFTWG